MNEKEKRAVLPDGRDIDPSALTTQMVWREIQNLEKTQANEIANVKEGIKVAHDDFTRVPTQLSTAISGLQTLMDEKIKHVREINDKDKEINDVKIAYEIKIKNIYNDAINRNFDRVEAHRLEYKADNAVSLDKALTYQKELNDQSTANLVLMTNKMETLLTKLIDAMGTTMNVGFNNLRETLGDLKNSQSVNQGKDTGKSQLGVWIFAGASFLFGFIATIVLLIKFLGGK